MPPPTPFRSRGRCELVDRQFDDAAAERQIARIRGTKQRLIRVGQQARERALVRRRAHEDARRERGRKSPVITEVAIERDERPAEIERALKMIAIGGAAQIVVLDHEEHVPAKLPAHDR